MARLLRIRLARQWGVYLAAGATIGKVRFPHPVGIVIGEGTVIEDGATIYQNVTIGAATVDGTDYPTLRSGCVIFAGAVVIGAVEIGENATVAANAVVTQSVPQDRVAVGVPARIV
jgi:serine O-acetyltransferase